MVPSGLNWLAYSTRTSKRCQRGLTKFDREAWRRERAQHKAMARRSRRAGAGAPQITAAQGEPPQPPLLADHQMRVREASGSPSGEPSKLKAQCRMRL